MDNLLTHNILLDGTWVSDTQNKECSSHISGNTLGVGENSSTVLISRVISEECLGVSLRKIVWDIGLKGRKDCNKKVIKIKKTRK
jgi:hypothetical protein